MKKGLFFVHSLEVDVDFNWLVDTSCTLVNKKHV